MKSKNKAKQVREALSLTPTEADKLLFGYDSKKAYDMWTRWERDDKLSLPTEQYFDLILFLAMCRDLKTPGSMQALDRYIGLLKDNEENKETLINAINEHMGYKYIADDDSKSCENIVTTRDTIDGFKDYQDHQETKKTSYGDLEIFEADFAELWIMDFGEHRLELKDS